MRHILAWVRLHPWIATSFFAGTLLGVTFCLPLVPYELPDSHASLIGAALGAFVAVWGAAWVADGKDSRNRELSRSFIRKELWRFRTELRQQLESAELSANEGNGNGLEEACLHLSRIPTTYKGLPKTLDSMRQLFVNLGPPGIVAHIEISEAVNEIFQLLGMIEESVANYYEVEGKIAEPQLRLAAGFGRINS